MTYLLDTNVFIEAKNRYYGLDFCPAFWEWLDQAHAAGVVSSIDKVATELTGQEDQLASWAGHRPRTFFLEADPALLPSLQVLSGWAIGAGYKPAAVTTFLGGADYYLVAHAHGHNHIVVTQEVPAPPPSKSIKIP
ncbi:MAG: DUF4411 family protein [Acidimicrobiales bacterium]